MVAFRTGCARSGRGSETGRVCGPGGCGRLEKNGPENPQHTGRSTGTAAYPNGVAAVRSQSVTEVRRMDEPMNCDACTQGRQPQRSTHILWNFVSGKYGSKRRRNNG